MVLMLEKKSLNIKDKLRRNVTLVIVEKMTFPQLFKKKIFLISLHIWQLKKRH